MLNEANEQFTHSFRRMLHSFRRGKRTLGSESYQASVGKMQLPLIGVGMQVGAPTTADNKHNNTTTRRANHMLSTPLLVGASNGLTKEHGISSG